MNGERFSLAPFVIFAVSAAAVLVGGAVSGAVGDAVAHAGDDDIDLTPAMFDGRSVGAGIVAAIVAALVTITLLDVVFKKRRR